MPKSEAHILRSTSLLRLEALGPEILSRVLRLCHPLDLVQLANTSRAFRSLLPDDSTLWRSAQLNLAVGVCPPLPRNPSMAARGNYSSSAYVRWIFGGGKCSVCLLEEDPPGALRFTFNLRACSRKCEKYIHAHVLVSFPSDHPIHSAPWRSLLDSRVYRRPSGQQDLVFKQSQVTAIEAEWGRAEAAGDSSLASDSAGVVPARSISELQAVCQMREATFVDREEVFCTVTDAFISLTVTENAHQLARWNIAYQKQKALVVQKNSALLKTITRAENVRFGLLVDTKTVRKLLDVFNRDLEEVTPLATDNTDTPTLTTPLCFFLSRNKVTRATVPRLSLSHTPVAPVRDRHDPVRIRKEATVLTCLALPSLTAHGRVRDDRRREDDPRVLFFLELRLTVNAQTTRQRDPAPQKLVPVSPA
ncbi:hypothetical protein MKEN_01367900 [Mycena kentingensis (nom. inval.)]|nr:hypothetical protein MKEN_01367900 [Mycena kentingensis (nom. inval.)]